VKASVSDVLREAVRDQHSSESFEKALGRIVRKHRGTFEDYVDLIGRVRRRAEEDRQGLVSAAKALTDQNR